MLLIIYHCQEKLKKNNQKNLQNQRKRVIIKRKSSSLIKVKVLKERKRKVTNLKRWLKKELNHQKVLVFKVPSMKMTILLRGDC